MSDIKAGDLVITLKPRECGCETASSRVGSINSVISLHENANAKCLNCGHLETGKPFARLSNGNLCELQRLKKIPPLTELESTLSHEDVKA